MIDTIIMIMITRQNSLMRMRVNLRAHDFVAPEVWRLHTFAFFIKGKKEQKSK